MKVLRKVGLAVPAAGGLDWELLVLDCGKAGWAAESLRVVKDNLVYVGAPSAISFRCRCFLPRALDEETASFESRRQGCRDQCARARR